MNELNLVKNLCKTEYASFYSPFDAASQNLPIASLSADGDYSVALFDAAKTKALAYLAAEVAQIKADYAKEAEPAVSRAAAYAREDGGEESVYERSICAGAWRRDSDTARGRRERADGVFR